jgi:two-component system, OmpR family, sensor histidine kinase TctE
VATEERRSPGGLYLQLVDWMLVPLVVLWPTVVIVSHFVALQLADEPFDRELRAIVLAVAEEAENPRPGASDDDRYPAVVALRSVPGERFLVQVADSHAQLLAGDAEIPPPPMAAAPGDVQFREVALEKDRFRVGYVVLAANAGAPGAIVQVAESLARRKSLASGVTSVVMVVMIVIVPVMVGLVWFGLYRGLLPLRQLSQRIRARDANDLSPIPPGDAPDEIAPLLDSLNAQLERVRHNLEVQRRFVADAAHQLRTPLAGLKSQAQVALREWPDPVVHQRLTRIEEGADRVGRLATQLLALARADKIRNQAGAWESVDLDALLRQVCEQGADAAIARAKSIAFEPAGAPAVVAGIPDLLHEMFTNVIDNAIRYSTAGGEVTVRVTAGECPEVAVEDRGPGIPPAERELVFERFYRVLGTQESGSGLGLAIAREIVEAHGAQIRVEDREGGGTRVVIAFPAPGKP